MELRKFLLFLAFVINYTADLVLIIIWRNFLGGYLLSVVIGFVLGLVARNTRNFLVLMVSSYVVASFMGTLVFASPALRPNMIWFQVEVAILGATAAIAYNSFIIVPVSILFGFFGLFVYDRLVEAYKASELFDSKA